MLSDEPTTAFTPDNKAEGERKDHKSSSPKTYINQGVHTLAEKRGLPRDDPIFLASTWL